MTNPYTNKLNIESIDSLLNYLVVGMAFLMPVFFLPITSEFFEFNKLGLVSVGTILMLLVWGVKMLINKKVEVVKSPLNLSIVALLAVYILSTVFSLNPFISMFGKYGRWFPSLYGFVTMVVFYYVVVVNVKRTNTVRMILLALVGGITINSLVSLLSYFGLYLSSAPYAQTPNFGLTGSPTTSAVLGALAVVLSLSFILTSEKTPTKVFLVQVALANFVFVALMGSFTGWAVLLTGLISTILLTGKSKLMESSVHLMVLAGGAGAFVLMMMLPQTKALLTNESFIKETQLSAKHSWVVSASTVTNYPLLGSGPSTFQINFTRFRPLELNATNYWALRFDKPFNEAFNILSDMGILGGLVGMFFIYQIVKMLSKSSDRTTAIALVSLSVAFMFTYTTVLTGFIFFLLLALLTARQGEHSVLSLSALSPMSLVSNLSDKGSASKEVLQYIMAIPIVAFTILWGYYTYKNYAGEYYMRKAIVAMQANNADATYTNQSKAIATNGQRAEYRNTFAQTNLILASNLSRLQEISDEQKQAVQALVAQAIREIRVSTETVNPLSASSWETRASLYRSLVGAAQDAEQWALGAYTTAIQLDPSNPRLRLEAGGVYYATGDYLSAANYFRQATNLKADYANAHYNLAQALVQLQSYQLAQRELEVILRLVPAGSPDYIRVTAEIEELKKLTAGAAAANPTVEQLEQQAIIEAQETTTPQEPLTQPGEEANPATQPGQPEGTQPTTPEPAPAPEPTPEPTPEAQ